MENDPEFRQAEAKFRFVKIFRETLGNMEGGELLIEPTPYTKYLPFSKYDPTWREVVWINRYGDPIPDPKYYHGPFYHDPEKNPGERPYRRDSIRALFGPELFSLMTKGGIWVNLRTDEKTSSYYRLKSFVSDWKWECEF